jgi:methionyl-tRNA formyltransferase
VSNKTELSELFKDQDFNSKVGLVVDFGIIINQDVLDYFPLGIVNSHFSLLPEWRGPDPITFSLLSGQKVTGVSIMLISEKMDEGMLIAQKKYKISDTINIQDLTSDLVDLSIKLLNKYLPEYIEGKIQPYPQDLKIKPTYSTFLKKSDGVIDLTKPADQLEREILAYLGWPGSKTILKFNDGSELEITVTEVEVISEADDSPLTLKTSKDFLKITKLKLPGKQEMSAKDFLNGYRHKF